MPSTSRSRPRSLCLFALLLAASCDSEVDAPAIDPQVALSAQRLFPSDEPGWSDCIYASPVRVESRGETFVLVAAGDSLSAIDPESGEPRWGITLLAPAQQRVWIVATPAVAAGKLVVAFQRTQTNDRTRLS